MTFYRRHHCSTVAIWQAQYPVERELWKVKKTKNDKILLLHRRSKRSPIQYSSSLNYIVIVCHTKKKEKREKFFTQQIRHHRLYCLRRRTRFELLLHHVPPTFESSLTTRLENQNDDDDDDDWYLTPGGWRSTVALAPTDVVAYQWHLNRISISNSIKRLIIIITFVLVSLMAENVIK